MSTGFDVLKWRLVYGWVNAYIISKITKVLNYIQSYRNDVEGMFSTSILFNNTPIQKLSKLATLQLYAVISLNLLIQNCVKNHQNASNIKLLMLNTNLACSIKNLYQSFSLYGPYLSSVFVEGKELASNYYGKELEKSCC